MKFILSEFLVLTTILGQSRLSLNDPKCSNYYLKFWDPNNPDGAGVTELSFTGDITVLNRSDITINLRYIDDRLFNDDLFFGLVKEDGKPEENTCLDLKLWKFTSNAFSEAVQVTDLAITSSNNSQNRWRYYHFTIPKIQFKERLIETQNSNQFIYKGYYAIAYYAAGTDQVQYTFYFEFSVIIEKETGQTIDTAFKPFSQISTYGCIPNQSCILQPDSVLKWCADPNCNSYFTTAPDLHLNDLFVLQQVVTTKGTNNYYLTGIEVWFTANGLYKKAKSININNSIKGQAIIQLKAEIAWRQFSIRVISLLSSKQIHGSRLLNQSDQNQVTGETNQISCLKFEGKDTCATCEEQCQVNGFAEEGCEKCQSTQENSNSTQHPSNSTQNTSNSTQNPSNSTQNPSNSTENITNQNEDIFKQNENSFLPQISFFFLALLIVCMM